MKFSWVIPTYSKKQDKITMLFNECIDTFVRYHGKDEELIVCDDGSPKEFQNQVIQECRKRNLLCIASQTNAGFPTNSNRGLRAATGDILVLVNSDVQFTQAVKKQFEAAFASDPKIGIVGALLFYPDGKIQHGGHLWTGKGFTHRGWHQQLKDAPEVLKPGYLIGVTGALFAFRKSMLDEIGLFNENYFLACDDSEICLRAWQAGWRVFYEPEIRAIHAEGATRGRTDIEKIRDHHEWFIKEMATWKKFFETDLKRFNISEITSQVNESNAQLLGVRSVMPEKSGPSSEMMVFEPGAQGLAPINANGSKILVRRTGALGDVLLATGVIKKLKSLHPNHQIVVSTMCWDIFQNNPNVSQVVKNIETVKDKCDQFIDLDLSYENNPKVPIWEAYAKTAFGDVGNGGEFYPPQLFSTPKDYETLRPKLGSVNPDIDRVAVLHMGVSWVNRTWPRHYWVEVARRLASSGYKVITVGRGGDFRADLYNNVSNLVDYLNVLEIRELISRVSVFVGVDSGILHIAQTTETPIVGIFTVANPQYRIVPRLKGRTIAVVPKVECRFCLNEKAPPVTFIDCKFGTNHCLNDILPDHVLSAVDNCLSR